MGERTGVVVHSTPTERDVWIGAGRIQRVAAARAVVVADEDDSRAVLIADAIAEAIATRFEGTLELVNEPGPGVIILYMALTDLKMKKKRGVLGYTPIGAIAHGATAQKKYEHPDKLAKKINMISAKLEVEGVDGASGDRIGVHILNIAGKQKGREEKSWEALKDEINDLAERFYKNYTTKRAEEQ